MKNYFTIEAKVDYLDSPPNMRNGWSPAFGSAFLDYVGTNPGKIKLFVSENGRLCKKCIFIDSQQLAEQFCDHLMEKLIKRYKSIELEVRLVDRNDLMYRKKNVESDSIKNDQIIRAYLLK